MTLRERAERKLADERRPVPSAPARDTGALEHELHVHQMELEMQNEELRGALFALEEVRDRYVELFELAPIAYVTLDRSGVITEANFAAAALFQMDRGALVGKVLAKFIAKARAKAYALRLGEVLAGDDRAAIELELAASRVPVRLTFRAIRRTKPDGKILGARLALLDLSEIRDAHASLDRERHDADRIRHVARAAEDRFQMVIETALDAILTMDRRGTIETINPAGLRMFGYPAGELVGCDVSTIMPPPDREPRAPHLAEGAGPAALIGQGREVIGRRQDGSTFPAHLTVNAMDIDGERRLCGFVRDLTEAKRAEAQLRHAQRMEAIGTLASGVAHDFNNLLMGVSVCASVALNRLGADSPARPFLEEVRRAVDGGVAMTKQLLMFGRRDAPTAPPRPLELDRAIAATAPMLRRLLGEDIDLAVDLRAPGLGVRLDSGGVDQLLLNLVLNARDAMPHGGRLAIETRETSLDRRRATSAGLPPGRYVALRVVDSGLGMSPEVRERALEPFFTTKGIGSGTGLGLSMVYGITKAAGGRVSIDSQPNAGTAVELLLPVTHLDAPAADVARDAATDAPPARPAEGAPGSILIVEDNRAARIALAHHLESEGWQVTVAGSKAEALDRLRTGGAVDVLLADYGLTDGKGDGLAREARALFPGLAIAYMSGYPNLKLDPPGRLLEKPFGLDAVSALVRSLVPPRGPGLAAR